MKFKKLLKRWGAARVIGVAIIHEVLSGWPPEPRLNAAALCEARDLAHAGHVLGPAAALALLAGEAHPGPLIGLLREVRERKCGLGYAKGDFYLN